MISVLDQIIVLVFLILVLGGGFLIQRIKKVHDHLTFIVAKNMAPAYVVVGLICAEMIHGGQTVGFVGWMQIFGISAVWYLVIISIGFWIVIPVVARLRAQNYSTIPEIVKNYMDAKCGVIVSLINIFFYIAVMSAIVYLSSAALMGGLFGWPAWLSMLSVGLVIVVYSSTAGLWSLGYLNFGMYVIILITTLFAGIYSTSIAGGIGACWSILPATGMPSQELFFPGPVGWPFVLLFVVFFWPFGYLTWAGINRSFMAADSPQVAKKAAIYAGLSYFIFIIGIVLVGLAALKLFPGIQNPDLAYPKLIAEYFPVGLAGLTIVGILAAMITTGGNCIFVVGTTISHDLIKAHIAKNLPDKAYIWIARAAMIFFGLIMIPICLNWEALVFEALMFSYAIGAGGIIMPSFLLFIQHLYVKKGVFVTNNGYFWGCVIGFVFALTYYIVTKDASWACIWGALLSLGVTLLISIVEVRTGRATEFIKRSIEARNKLVRTY